MSESPNLVSEQFKLYAGGLGNSAAYAVSGIPFITGSIALASGTVDQVDFPLVTQFVTIQNNMTGSAAPLRVGASYAGVEEGGSNYFVLNNGESYTVRWKLAKIFLRPDDPASKYTIIAGLAGIQVSEMAHNWSGTSGVG